MNCPVIVENNIKAFAEGELLYGMGKTEENLLFLKWGPGVGSAMVIGNQVYEGAGVKQQKSDIIFWNPDRKNAGAEERDVWKRRFPSLPLRKN